jgi:hypothetical protein
VHNGAYLIDCQVAETADHAKNEENVEKLWKFSVVWSLYK